MLKGLFLLALVTFASCALRPEGHQDEVVISVKEMVSPSDSLSAQPFLFTDSKGSVYLSWIESGEGKSTLKFSVLKDEVWSTPQVIATGKDWFVNWADFPMVVSDGGNVMLAHFLEKSAESTFAYDIKVRTSEDKGASWSLPLTLHDDGQKAEHGFVSFIPLSDAFFVSWLDGRNTVGPDSPGGHGDGHHGQMTLRGAIMDAKGNKSKEWQLDDRVCDCCQTSSAVTTNGPVVVYRDRSAEEIRDIAIVRSIDGEWTSPKTVFEDNWQIAGCPVNGPQVAALGNDLAVAWFSAPEGEPQVKLAFSEDGGTTFYPPIRVDEGNTIGRVGLVMLDAGTAMVSWMEGAEIKATKVRMDGVKDASITIAESSEARKSGFPQMTKAGDKLIFAWTDDKAKIVKVASLAL